ncbi:hypothetical protein F8M41_019653 [Gigaspora margarita]|uniref:Protein kinase domain-containing protein n=1 Tax=Gigaspora margarita TaxID=4874 RepID=A0A8H4AJR1_GIGMA|nr:hypothetical protein F8M41_019653 [Gigaspora margarita]
MVSSEKIKETIEKEEIKLFEYNSFVKLKSLGKGGFGDVDQVYSNDIKEIVALKKVRNNNESFKKEVWIIFIICTTDS